MITDTWRADFFDNPDDTKPSRTEIIQAINENEAADVASKRMGNARRVDVTRTVLKSN